jgi:hypothetical protein
LCVQLLSRFTCGQALRDDEAAGFNTEFGEGSFEPDCAQNASYSSDGDRDRSADAIG